MDQAVINWLLTGFGVLLGAVLKTLWETVKDLQNSDKQMAAEVSKMQVLVAGQYVTRQDFQQSVNALFAKLDSISDKLDTKVDK